MVALVARQGRELQRYNSNGGRLVVGCIPYKFKNEKSRGNCTNIDEVVEVLVISSQKGHGMMFPKGGWELDETAEQAASREALEEAGVQGHLEDKLGKWMYKSKSQGIFYEGIMYPLNVTEELNHWPEMGARKRRWVSVSEAMEGCEQWWMKEALENLVRQLSSSPSKKEAVSFMTTMTEAHSTSLSFMASMAEARTNSHNISFTKQSTEKPLIWLCV